LQPYHNNITKRTIKTPKIYFMDTGLAAYLTRWPTSETLQVGSQAGAFFENFIIAEIYKSYYNAGIIDPPLYFYRDRDQREIDLLIQVGNILHPVEIKKYADPRREDVAAFGLLDKIPGVVRGSGGVVCMYDNLVTLKGEDRVIPVKFL
jgi:predicted AAA+ superfamily ATPase